MNQTDTNSQKKNGDSSVVHNQWNSEKTYQARTDFLMSGGADQVGAIYIDVTQDQLIRILWDGYEKNTIEHSRQEVYHWLETNIYPYIPDQESRDEFNREFSRTNLIQTFQEGRPQLRTRHRFQKGNRVCCYRVNVNMFQNPANGHIEACATWEDYTRKYVDEQIQDILYQADYKALGLIEMDKQILYIRSNHFEEMKLEDDSVLSYNECVRNMCRQRILGKDQEQFARCTSLEYLSDNMAMAGEFSFTVRNTAHEVERYTYYWFDEEQRLLLFVVDDMTKASETDALTGALNRTGFSQKAEEIIHNNPDKRFALLYFNIQRFKAINDLFGYDVGDDVLCDAMQALQTCYLKPLAVGRVEADHFTVLTEADNVELDRLPEVLHGTLYRNDMRIDIYGRCGIYYIPENCRLSVSDMCDRAKLAKTYIANQYVQPYSVFNGDMRKEYEQRSIALIQLEHALKNDEFHVYYQPIFDVWTRKIVSAEALVRWISRDNEVILPKHFIPALEESGHITKLDLLVNSRVHEFLEKRFHEGKRIVPVTVNLSRMDLMDNNIMDKIRRDIINSRLPKENFRYEITESAYAEINETGSKFLTELRKYGVKMLVDDFGSGLSSFSTVRDFEFDIIKLDMGFVHRIGRSKKNNNILISIIELAHRLGMKVVAEGVETEEQIEFLRDYGCDFIQGFYFSKPLPQGEFERLLA